jgi:hypothetical protein
LKGVVDIIFLFIIHGGSTAVVQVQDGVAATEVVPAATQGVVVVNTTALTTTTNTKKRGFGKVETCEPYASNIKKHKVVEDKVKEMVELDKYLATKYTVKTEGLTEKARQFYQRHVAKTVTCVNRCFAGDYHAFCEMIRTKLSPPYNFVPLNYKCECTHVLPPTGTTTGTGENNL